MYKNKRGLSEVVTAIIVILLVLVAVGIIWAVVQNLLEEGAGEAEGGVDCISTQISVERVTREGTGADDTTNAYKYNVTVARSTGGPESVSDLRLVFSTSTKSQTVTPAGTIAISELGKQSFTLLQPTDFDTSLESAATKVAVAAVISGRTCNPTGEKAIA
ncbi:MAG: archaellin/type IV pilin N-terminal domain-containing protein [Nanoarchaeota archaeon]